MVKKGKFIIIDGNAILHRAWHALPPLTAKDGKLVNAVYGFAMIFIKVLKELKPAYIAVTFDKKAPTFRHEEFKEYKANRVKQPDELYDQIPRVKELVEAFGAPIYEKDGFEADDVIATLVNQSSHENIIVTGDLDTLQLVDKMTKIYTSKKGITDMVIYDENMVKERYGLPPSQMIDFKALRGDPSDNIPGVKGIGEKTASELLQKFGSLEKIYEALTTTESKDISPKIKEALITHQAEAKQAKRLVTLIKDVPLKFNQEEAAWQGINLPETIKLFQELGFKSLLNKIETLPNKSQSSIFSADVGAKEPDKNFNYQLVDDEKKFRDFIKKFREQEIFAFDTESTGLDPFRAELLGISFSWQGGAAYYLPVNKNQTEVPRDFLEKELRPIIEDEKIKKIGHNIKYDLEMLASFGWLPQGVYFDTMIASYLLNPGSRIHGLDSLAFSEFGHQKISIKSLIGHGRQQISLAEVAKEKVSDYSCEDADYTWRLFNIFKKELEEKKLLELFQRIEMPLIPILAKMESWGLEINDKKLALISKKISGTIKELKKKIYHLAGSKFNINSPLQLKEILFKNLKISTFEIKKIKTGFSTAASELEKLKTKHPIINLVGEYRELSKLKSTYLDALPELINPKTGRIHTSFNQTVTATGRLSSSEPNLQNIPAKGVWGSQIRSAFIAPAGYQILAADYSQIELRIVASFANDEKMIDSFRKGEDIHTRTAAEIHNCPLAEVTKEMRRKAKEVNFGVLYGMRAYGLAERTEISREEAKNFIDKYFMVYQGIKKYIDKTIEETREKGYAETLFGRRRYLPEINSGVMQVRSAAERMAINMPIQGTAADLIKLAMIKIFNILKEFKEEEIKMILQVHDELVFEVKKDLADKIAKIVKIEMERVIKLKAPIEVKLSIGPNWGETEELNIKI